LQGVLGALVLGDEGVGGALQLGAVELLQSYLTVADFSPCKLIHRPQRCPTLFLIKKRKK